MDTYQTPRSGPESFSASGTPDLSGFLQKLAKLQGLTFRRREIEPDKLEEFDRRAKEYTKLVKEEFQTPEAWKAGLRWLELYPYFEKTAKGNPQVLQELEQTKAGWLTALDSPRLERLIEGTSPSTAQSDAWRIAAARETGVPPRLIEVDKPVPFTERWNLAGGDIPSEVVRRGGLLGYPLTPVEVQPGETEYLRPTEQGLAFTNTPGFDVGDIAQFGREVGAQTAGATAADIAMLTPTPGTAGIAAAKTAAAVAPKLAPLIPKAISTAKALTGLGLGGFGGKAAEETIETWDPADVQHQGMVEGILRPGARAGTEEALGGLLARMGVKTWNLARHGFPGSPTFATDIAKAEMLRRVAQEEYGFDLPAPYLGAMLDHPAIRVLGQQSEATTGAMSAMKDEMSRVLGEFIQTQIKPGKNRVAEAAQQLADQALLAQRKKTAGFYAEGDVLFPGSAAERDVGRITGGIAGEKSSIALKKAYEDVTDSWWNKVSSGYKQLDRIALEENPRFDLSDAQENIGRMFGEVRAARTEIAPILNDEGVPLIAPNGEPLTHEITKWINVAEPGPARLDRINRLIQSIDPEQKDYRILKELRTQTGRMIREMPWEQGRDTGSGQALKMWEELTNVLENPTNDAPRFTDMLATVVPEAKAYYRAIRQPSYQTVMKSEVAAGLFNTVMEQPDMLVTPAFREIVSKAPPKQRDVLRAGFRQSLILNPSPRKTLDALIAKSENSVDFMFGAPGSPQRRSLERAVDEMETFYRSPVGQMSAGRYKAYETLQTELRRKSLTPREMDDLAASVGEAGRPAIQMAIIDNILDGSLKGHPKSGERMIKAGDLNWEIQNAKENGQWNYLTENQKKVLEGAEAYSRRFLASIKDVGVSLQANSVISKMKKPSTFLSGLHTLAANKAIAAVLTAPGLSEKMKLRILNEARPVHDYVADIMAPLLVAQAHVIAGLPDTTQRIGTDEVREGSFPTPTGTP